MESLFKKITDIIDTLLGPNGCPWDRKQTLLSIAPCLLEETCEAIDAIHDADFEHIQEELGDVLFTAIFCCKLAEKEKKATCASIIEHVVEKYIRRHPHVFGDKNPIETQEEVLTLWQKIKDEENQKKKIVPDIPKSLPSLTRAKKVIKKLSKVGIEIPKDYSNGDFSTEEAFGEWLFTVVARANALGYDPEMALRKSVEQHIKKTNANIEI